MNLKKLIFCMLFLLSEFLGIPTIFATGRNNKRSDAPTNEIEPTPQRREQSFFSLGEQYYFGRGVPVDYITARDCFLLAEQYAIDLEERAQTYLYLAEIYYYGCQDMSADHNKALHYFVKAEAQTTRPDLQVHARLHLGELYYYGMEIPQDYTKARRSFELIKDQTLDPEARAAALFYLGKIYYLGQGVRENHEKAFTYFKAAAEQAPNQQIQANVMLYLAQHYYTGQGTTQNQPLAFQLFQQYIDLTTDREIKAWAWFYLGQLHYWGIDTPMDLQKALHYFILAAHQTDELTAQSWAKTRIQTMYTANVGITPPENSPIACCICMDTPEDRVVPQQNRTNASETPAPQTAEGTRNAFVVLPCPNNHETETICRRCLGRLMNTETPTCPLCRSKMIKITL